MRPPLVFGVAVAVVFMIVIGCLVHQQGAAAELRAAQRQAERQMAELQRWTEGQGRLSAVAGGAAAGADVVTQVQQALTTAGLPVAAFRGVQPLAEHAEPATGMVERTINVHFADLRPAEVGAWLAAWQGPKQPWQITGLVLTHPPSVAESALDNERFQITLTLLLRTVASP